MILPTHPFPQTSTTYNTQHTCFRGQPVKDVIDEAVHDVHGLVADPGVRMHLLQHLEDVQGPGPGGPPLALLRPLHLGGLGLGALALATALATSLLLCSFGRHC